MKKRILLLCVFCITLGFTYAQTSDRHITNKVTVAVRTYETETIALIKADNLKKAWKASYIIPSFRQPHSTSVQCQRLHLPLPQEPFLQKTFHFSPFSTAGGLGFSPKCVWISKRYACKTSSTDFHRLPHAESIMLPFL